VSGARQSAVMTLTLWLKAQTPLVRFVVDLLHDKVKDLSKVVDLFIFGGLVVQLVDYRPTIQYFTL
jgi:hypothetical protein